MPKIEPFEKFAEAYDQWFEKNADAYQAELELIRGLLPDEPGGSITSFLKLNFEGCVHPVS